MTTAQKVLLKVLVAVQIICIIVGGCLYACTVMTTMAQRALTMIQEEAANAGEDLKSQLNESVEGIGDDIEEGLQQQIEDSLKDLEVDVLPDFGGIL